jgi:hypothetical protein
MPAPDSGDDFVWIGRPCEWPRLDVVLDKEAIDCRLQVNTSALASFLVQ